MCQANPENTSRLNRSETLAAALKKRSADAKISELLAQSDARGSSEYALVKDMTVSQFLHDVSPDDPVLSELRSKVFRLLACHRHHYFRVALTMTRVKEMLLHGIFSAEVPIVLRFSQVKRWLYDCTVPYTTRAPRAGELNGRDFNFVTPDVFDFMVLNDDFIEHGSHKGFQYGTPRVSSADVAHSTSMPRHSRSRRAQLQSGAVTVADLFEAVGEVDTVVDGVLLNGQPVAGCDVAHVYKSVSVDVPDVDGDDDAALVAVKQALQHHAHRIAVPVTTRPKRQGERDGVHYTFVTEHEFYRLVANDQLLEFGDHNGYFYGTPTPTKRDLAAYVRGTSAGQLKRGVSAAAVGSDGDVEVTMGDVRPFLTQEASMVPDDMVLSEFFHRVPEGDATHAALRSEVLQYVYDHTVPYTTRPQRTGERDGQDYHFVAGSAFHALIRQQFFFEYSELNDVFYGTPRLSKRAHFRDGDVTQPAYSRRAHVDTMLANEIGEVTLGHFVDKYGMESLARHRDVPVSVYLANVDPEHPGYGETRKSLQQILYRIAVPVTTRAPRENEKDGREYKFVSHDEFDKLVADHALIEHGTSNDNHYGTLRLLARDLDASYARLGAIRDHHYAMERHATVNEVLDGSYKHTALARVGAMSYSQFLKFAHPDDATLADLRAHVKAAIYAALVPGRRIVWVRADMLLIHAWQSLQVFTSLLRCIHAVANEM